MAALCFWLIIPSRFSLRALLGFRTYKHDNKRTHKESKGRQKMPQVMPVEKSKNDTFFVLVTRVFWRRCFVCGGKLFKNAYSCEQNENGNNDKNQLTITLARTLAFGNTLVAITHAFPKKFSLSYDCEDATANACKQKHLS